VTTFIPETVASQPRKSAAGGTHSLTTQPSSQGDGLRLALGNRRLMLEQAVSVGVEAQTFMQTHEAQARTCVLVGINGNVVAAMAIADPLKPEARAVVAALHTQVRPGHMACHADVAYIMLHSVRRGKQDALRGLCAARATGVAAVHW
jgi:hypothetical protein